jgi:uncharacterized membrane protein YeiH
MLHSLIIVLDWFGICVFAITGALVASRKQMDIVGFAMLGSVTGIGGAQYGMFYSEFSRYSGSNSRPIC